MNIVDKIIVDPITRGLKFFTKGGVVVSQSPVGMSDQLATQLGLKQYLHGTTYNGGIAPTLTLTGGGGTLNSVARTVFIPYQMHDGSWRMRFNLVNASLSSAVRTTLQLTLSGVTFGGGGINIIAPALNVVGLASVAYTITGGGAIECTFPSNTINGFYASGDVELNSKPTWAY